MERIFLPVEASLANPNDPAEVTLVADLSSVGITNRTSTGQLINWTADILRARATTLIGKPVNVLLQDGRVTGHSRNVVGTIIEAAYDETSQRLRIVASLWKHYFPETIAQLADLARKGALQVSAEFMIAQANRDNGVTEPTDGLFTGVAIVEEGADPRNKVLVLASALKSDKEAEQLLENEVEVLPQSYEWAGEQIAEYLANNEIVDATVIGTYPDQFVYTSGENTNSVTITTNNGNLAFGEPTVWSESTGTTAIWGVVPSQEPATPQESKNMEELAEVQASRDRAQTDADSWKSKFEELEASVKSERDEREAEKAAAVAVTLANTRIGEIEKIAPYKDATLKAEHLELFKTADDKTYEVVKSLIAATVEPKGGIASEGGLGPTDEDADPVLAEAQKNLPQWREEMLALFPKAATPQE